MPSFALMWRHNERYGVSNHRRLDCSLNRCSGADQRKHQSPASLAFVRGIHRSLVDSPHKGPVTRQMFPFDDVIMVVLILSVHVVYNIDCPRCSAGLLLTGKAIGKAINKKKCPNANGVILKVMGKGEHYLIATNFKKRNSCAYFMECVSPLSLFW